MSHDQLYEHGLAHEPEPWDDARVVTPLPRQREIVGEVLELCRRDGVTVPAHTLVWITAPLRRGRCERYPDGRTAIWLNANLSPADLAGVAAHEYQHASDYAAGLHRSLTRVQLEERAINRANRIAAVWTNRMDTNAPRFR